MSRREERPLTYRSLFESPVVAVREYHCRACRGGPSVEEYSDSNNIVFMRQGAFAKHFGRRSVVADVNQTVFFSRGSTYRVSHPADCGDRGTIFAPAPATLRSILRELDPSTDDDPELSFPFVIGPCAPDIFWRNHHLVLSLTARRSPPQDPLSAEVTALELIADALRAAFARYRRPHKRRRTTTDADHADRAEAAKAFLATHLSTRVSLTDVARAAHTSPFHLARLFQERTGMPVHRYLTHLRLRASLERLAEGATDLASLALALGFSSHSHFTDTFRREFGRTPSRVRQTATSRRMHEMSKNLEV